jgi:arylsulfatase A-like enzyme
MPFVSDPRLRVRNTWLLALAATLGAALVHVSLIFVRVHGVGQMLGYARELPWLAVAGFAPWFAALALLFTVAGRVTPRLASLQVQVAVHGAAVTFAALLHLGRIHGAAVLLLAVGVGVQLGRMAARDDARALRSARWTATGAAALLLLAGIPGVVLYRARQASQLAGLPAAREGAPNVILLILDTVRAANLSAYGYARPTSPALEQLAREGTLFESAISPAPWTGPSHAAMLTGRYPHFSGIWYVTPMADSLPTVAEAFRQGGYATGAFVGNAFYAGRVTGFDRAFVRYDDYPVSWEQAWWSANFSQVDLVRQVAAARSGPPGRLMRVLRNASLRVIGENHGARYDASEVVSRFLGWQDEVAGRPYFAMLNLFDAHAPYDSPLAQRFGEGRRPEDRYDGAIAYMDSVVGTLVNGLRERGTLDRTVLVVVSDHGEHFGEHDIRGHGNSLFLELLHVPLVIRAPGRVPSGARVGHVASLRDIPATLLDLAGLQAPQITGHSLVPLARLTSGEPSTGSGSDDQGSDPTVAIEGDDPAGATPVAPDGAAPAAGARGGEGMVITVSPALAEADQPTNQRQSWPTSFGPMQALVTDEFHYLRRGDGREWVLRWRGDTAGRGDVTETEEGRAAIARSQRLLRRMLGARWTERGLSQ